MKRCCRCKEDKPFSLFNKNRSNKDGHSKHCKPCRVVIRSAHYAKNAEKIKEANRKYLETKPAWRKDYFKEHYKKNAAQYKQRARARIATVTKLPPWANVKDINAVYALATKCRAAGIDCHVDHIVPLKSDLVCGLHVQGNLAITQREDNARKSNRWWPDMPSGADWRS